MKAIVKVVAILIVASAVYLLAWPLPLDPVVIFSPQAAPAMTGVYAENHQLAEAKRFGGVIGHGPEATAIGPDGVVFTGLENGDIYAITADGMVALKLVNTGGRPLGMVVDAANNLIVADADKGLLSVSLQTREVSLLVNQYNGVPLAFVDDLDIAADGVIYFSDASTYNYWEYINDFWDGRPSGRLFSYNPATKETKLLAGDLFFANGVALGPNDEYVLVNETWAYRVQRLWLKGDKAGQLELFADNLPGMPDNITFNGTDRFWLGLPAPRLADIEHIQASATLKKIALRLPESLLSASQETPGMVLGLGLDGKPVRLLQDPQAVVSSKVTGALENNGRLFITSLEADSVKVLVLQ